MRTSIEKEINQEIDLIMDSISSCPFTSSREDFAYISVESPLVVDSDSPNPNRIGLVMYPELLSYWEDSQDVTVPWICVRIELEGEAHVRDREILPWIVSLFKDIGFTPFYDEDSYRGNWKRKIKKGWVEYKMYINPSYPEGYWQNHTL